MTSCFNTVIEKKCLGVFLKIFVSLKIVFSFDDSWFDKKRLGVNIFIHLVVETFITPDRDFQVIIMGI